MRKQGARTRQQERRKGREEEQQEREADGRARQEKEVRGNEGSGRRGGPPAQSRVAREKGMKIIKGRYKTNKEERKEKEKGERERRRREEREGRKRERGDKTAGRWGTEARE